MTNKKFIELLNIERYESFDSKDETIGYRNAIKNALIYAEQLDEPKTCKIVLKKMHPESNLNFAYCGICDKVLGDEIDVKRFPKQLPKFCPNCGAKIIMEVRDSANSN